MNSGVSFCFLMLCTPLLFQGEFLYIEIKGSRPSERILVEHLPHSVTLPENIRVATLEYLFHR